MFFPTEYLIALPVVLLALGWLAGLRSGERTRPKRVWLKGDWLRFNFGLYWSI